MSALKAARTEFANDMTDIDAFRGRAIDRLLGGKLDPSSPDFARNLLKLDRDSFSELIGIADDFSPSLGNAMRSVVWREMLDDASRIGSVTEDVLDTGKLVGVLNRMPKSKLKAFLGAGGRSEEEVGQMVATVRTLNAISEGTADVASAGGRRGIRERFEQWSINAASQDKGFIARLLAGEMTPGLMERLLFSPGGQEALLTLSKPRVVRAEIANAFSHIAVLMMQDEEQKATLQRMQLANRVGEMGSL